MNDDMRKMLGLDDDVPANAGALPSLGGASGPAAPAADTALDLDTWGLQRGASLADDTAAAVAAGERKKDKPLPTGHELADFHGIAFEPTVRLNESCRVPARAEYCRQLLESPEVADVRASTVGNPLSSEIAALTFAERWVSMAEEQDCRNPADGDGSPKRPAPGKGSGRKPAPSLADSVDMMKAVAGAAKAAKRAVAEFDEAMAALGCGGDGGGQGAIDPKQALETYRRVRGSATLKAIAEKAGRFRRMAAAKQRLKTTHGIDEIVGVTTGSDVARLTTTERARLADPVLSDELLLRIAEGKAQLLECRGMEPAGKGPIVVVVDESGSMNGEKIQNAKALALSLAWVARKQRRWTALVGFSGGTQGNILMLPPGRWDEVALMNWLEHFYGCGTDVDVPLIQLPNEFWPAFMAAGAKPGKTDVVMITDAEVNVPAQVEIDFKAWKKRERVKTYAIMIDSKPGSLDNVIDELHRITSAELRPDNAAVGSVLSV